MAAYTPSLQTYILPLIAGLFPALASPNVLSRYCIPIEQTSSLPILCTYEIVRPSHSNSDALSLSLSLPRSLTSLPFCYFLYHTVIIRASNHLQSSTTTNLHLGYYSLLSKLSIYIQEDANSHFCGPPGGRYSQRRDPRACTSFSLDCDEIPTVALSKLMLLNCFADDILNFAF